MCLITMAQGYYIGERVRPTFMKIFYYLRVFVVVVFILFCTIWHSLNECSKDFFHVFVQVAYVAILKKAFIAIRHFLLFMILTLHKKLLHCRFFWVIILHNCQNVANDYVTRELYKKLSGIGSNAWLFVFIFVSASRFHADCYQSINKSEI